jgi:preprotein translocase subunit YajC
VWQGVAASILLGFGIIVAVVGVVVYLRMYRKQKHQSSKSQDSPPDS